MSPFEFFFSFYGLLLAFSVAVVATGAVKSLKLRAKRAMGYVTPLLAVFILMDIASFWSWAWDSLRNLSFSYGLLILGMVIALIYFAAASFVFPDDDEKTWKSLDDHYDARKRWVLSGAMASNTILVTTALILTGTNPFGPQGLLATSFYVFYMVTMLTCWFVRSRPINALMLIANIALYAWVATITINAPPSAPLQPDPVAVSPPTPAAPPHPTMPAPPPAPR